MVINIFRLNSKMISILKRLFFYLDLKGDWHHVLGSRLKIGLEVEKTISFRLQPVDNDCKASPAVYLLQVDDGKMTVGQLELLKCDPLGRVAFRFQSMSNLLSTTSLHSSSSSCSELPAVKHMGTFDLFNRLRFAYPIGLNQILLQGEGQLSLLFEKKSKHFRYSGCFPV